MKAQSFDRFCATYGFDLTPAQRILSAVSFDGAEPASFVDSSRDVAREIFGDVDTIASELRGVVVWKKGARIGGSRMAGMQLYRLALTVPLSLAPGETAFGLLVGPDTRLPKQVLGFIAGVAQRDAASGRIRILSTRVDAITFERYDGNVITIECLPATGGGSAVRARTLVGAVMTEAAFFHDSDFVVNDAEVYRAIAPRIVRGGQLIIESTPWAESGLVFELFTSNFGHPSTAIAAHAPTLLMRIDDHTRSIVARERLRDPQNCAREFDAEFMTTGSGLFFDPRAIDESVERELVETTKHPTIAVGADFGFRSDASALVVVAKHGQHFEVIYVDEVLPEKGRPLDFNTVVDRFATAVKTYNHNAIVADLHYAEAIRSRLSHNQVTLRAAPEGARGKLETYVKAKALFGSGAVRLPNHPRLINQLKAVTSKPTSGGGLSISSPRTPGGGGHGDIVSALVLALNASAHGNRMIEALTKWSAGDDIFG